MITVLFWNTSRNEGLLNIIGNLVEKLDVDIVLLAEMQIPIQAILVEFNEKRKLSFHTSPSNCERIKVFSKYDWRFIRPIEESSYYTIRHINLPGCDDFLLVAAHLRSRLYQSQDSQNSACIELASDIRGVEERLCMDRTVITGDFNANPFDAGMVAANGLHGLMTQKQVAKDKRKVGGREYPFLYNPMWSFMGDLSEGPPGTYYYVRSEYVEYGWNMFDQVLVRPSMVQLFDLKSLKILTNIGEELLVKEGEIPDKSKSDHLPIIFSLDI